MLESGCSKNYWSQLLATLHVADRRETSQAGHQDQDPTLSNAIDVEFIVSATFLILFITLDNKLRGNR